MKHLFVYIFVIVFALCQALPVNAIPRAKSREKVETLKYDVYFHMGFIWAKAGEGTLSMSKETETDGTQRLHGQLAAKSHSIVEHIMKVRDTLDTWMNVNYVPREFTKNTHEGKYNCLERNLYQIVWKDKDAALTPANVKSTSVKVHRWRQKGSDAPSQADTLHHVSEPAYDMLSVFYVMRNMDFAHMKKGETKRFALFPGLKKNWSKVEYCGQEKITLRNGKKYDAYQVLITFSTKDDDSQPLKAWISKTPDHRPLMVTIGLSRIGSVQCELVE